MIYKIRNIKLEDAAGFLEMQLTLDNETKHMLYEPGERPNNTKKIKEMVEQSDSGQSLLLVAEVNNKIVGFLSAQKGVLNRISHSAYIVIGICQAYQGIGIGTHFFKELDTWARENKLTRLELTVVCHNESAVHLYEKSGFVIEGTKKNSMIVDGKYIDEYYMAKLIA